MKPLKQQAIEAILNQALGNPKQKDAEAWAATNIALCKYWGKRNDELNLPLTDSLSVMLPKHGVNCRIHLDTEKTSIIVNDQPLDLKSTAASHLIDYVDLFLTQPWQLNLDFNIPVAAGFASSAACYASIIKALNKLFDWQLSSQQLSALARLGSGSASRSIEPGFSVWQKGKDELGTDSFAYALKEKWEDLRIGLCVLSSESKPTSSRAGMRRTRDTSILYRCWEQQVEHDMPLLQSAIQHKNFELLGKTAEHNAMSMHATMESAWPPLVYSLPETRQLQHQIWHWRQNGKSIYFTQDAGPNLKLLFLERDQDWLQQQLPDMIIIEPFTED